MYTTLRNLLLWLKINILLFPKGTEDVSDVFILSPWEALFLQNKTVIYLKENNHEETKKYV